MPLFHNSYTLLLYSDHKFKKIFAEERTLYPFFPTFATKFKKICTNKKSLSANI